MRDIEVNSDWMSAVLVLLVAIVSFLGFTFDLVGLIRGEASPIRPADWPIYLVVATIAFSVIFAWPLWQESWKGQRQTYERMVNVFAVLWLIQIGFQIAVRIYPALSRNPQLEWSSLLLGITSWCCALIGVVDWFRSNVKLAPPTSSGPPDRPVSSQ